MSIATPTDPIDVVVSTIADTSGALVPSAPAPMVAPHNLGGLPYLSDFLRLAEAISRTEMVPVALRGRADAVVAVMMSGFEIGIGPLQSLQSINLIQGKPSLSAELMRALIVQAGHQFRTDATNERAVVQYRRKEWPTDEWSTVTFTIEDAQRAGLVEWYERWTKTETGKSYKQTWNPYGPDPKPDWVDAKGEHKRGENYFSRPRAMLSARATSEAARLDFADVIAGLSYTPDEVEEFAPVPIGLSKPGEISVVDPPPALPESRSVDPDADAAMHALGELIAGIGKELGTSQQEALVSHLRGRFGPSKDMDPAQIAEATAIAAGWPSTSGQPDAAPGSEPF